MFGGDHAAERRELFLRHAESVDALEQAAGIEHADDHLFAK